MDISESLSVEISRLFRIYATEPVSDSTEIKRLAIREKALPLFVDIGGVFAIKINGEIISIPWEENEEQPEVVSDKRVRNIAIFQGSKKYPELARFSPQRTEDSQLCPSCKGTGIEPISASLNLENVVCYCGGLGWVPKEDDNQEHLKEEKL